MFFCADDELETSITHSKKKRHSTESVDDLLVELMNETEYLDSTYVGGGSADTSLTSFSIDSLDKNIEPQHSTEEVELNRTEMIDPNTSSKSADVTFVSTTCDLNADKTTDSLFSEAVETEFVEFAESTISETLENGKVAVNQYSDPTDVLIAKLVSLHKNNPEHKKDCDKLK